MKIYTDEILVKYLLKETTKAETEAVEEWSRLSPENENYLRDLRIIWNASQRIGGRSEADTTEVWSRFQRKREKVPVVIQPHKYRWLQLAAACFFGLIFLFAVNSLLFPERSLLFASDLGTKDEIRTDTLADGSVITMNRYSELVFSQPAFRKERIVKMYDGEVFFRIKHDKRKPFIIKSGSVTITVLGTSFHVKQKNGKTEVIVESGLVRVEASGKKIELRPKEKLLVDGTSGKFVEEKVTDNLYNYYVDNHVELDNTPLWRVVNVLEEAYGVEISIADSDVATLEMTTTLVMGQLDDVLEVISKTLDLSVEKKGKTIILKKTIK